MRLLFAMDSRDYDPAGETFVRPSVRAILVREGKVAMVHSRLYNYYKFPGGGIEPGESREEALIRETAEEAGLRVLSETIRPFGYVHRVEKWEPRGRFIQDNYYYLCDCDSVPCHQNLDGYEQEEGFTLCYVTPETAISVNRQEDHGPKAQSMLEREARVLELLVEEGWLPAR